MHRVKCSCARRASPKVRALLHAIRMKGARAAGAKRHREAVARWLELATGLTIPDFGRLVYRRGYSNGYTIGERSGAAKGYERGFTDGQRQARFDNVMRRSA